MSASDFRRLSDPKYLVGHWPLNGHAQDVSGHGNHGTWSGTTAYVAGPFGRQVGSFGGAADCLTLGTDLSARLNGAPGVTMSIWFKNTDFPGAGAYDNEMISLSVAAVSGPEILMYNANSLFIGGRVSAAGGYLSTTLSYSGTGAWKHLAAVFDFAGSRLAAYLDGGAVMADAAAAWGATALVKPVGNFDTIGCLQNNAGRHFNGQLGDARLYSCALTGAEVRQLYLSELGGVLL